jgi:hypothetical protein
MSTHMAWAAAMGLPLEAIAVGYVVLRLRRCWG